MKNLLNNTENKRKVICVQGKIGAGKTLVMSTIASELKEELNGELFSNYGLANSLGVNDLNSFRNIDSEKPYIVCFDEFDRVLNSDMERVCTFLEDVEEQNIIILIASFVHGRLPESIKKVIDVNLVVEKESDEKIKVTGVNVKFDKVVEIEVGKKYYDAFKIAKTFL
ncbi:AAA family ATPase (plasmid) [Bacillus albus]|uniref:AAA family ATPase n=1 Tax=Bacillus cereus group TaxID=86661 RepID=UPI002E301025|nr:AAA family ATPase [Bacillus albus]